MINFEPSSLKDPFIAAVRALHAFAEIILDEWEYMHEPDFDFDDDDVELTVTPETVFSFSVGADESVDATVSELLALADELPESKVVDHLMYIGPTRAYVRVEPTNTAAYRLVNHLMQYPSPTARRFEVTAGDCTFALVNGYTPFAIHMLEQGEYDRDAFPTYHDHDLFIEARYPPGTKDDAWRELLPAFLFEVNERTGMAFAPTPRPEYAEIWPEEYDADQYLPQLDALRLRPLMTGPGMESLLRLYERATGRENDPEQHLVGYIKVMEYVAATVVNTERNLQVRRRLLSQRALAPDAGFIRDLVQLVEAQRLFKKDSEALRLTIETCCDPVDLAPYAPPHQKALAALRETSASADRKKALDALSGTLSATRNMFSHAKANYSLTGEECPETELPQLIECARVAAQQCVRWFALSDVSLRIVD